MLNAPKKKRRRLTITIITPRRNLRACAASLRHNATPIQVDEKIMIAYPRLAATALPEIDCGYDWVLRLVGIVVCTVYAGDD